MNLAEFPISILQWQRPVDQEGRLITERTFNGTRYEPATAERVPFRIVLESKAGLPTASDNLVLLGLLFLAKQANDFRHPRFHFVPYQLLNVLSWSDKKANYDRIRGALRRYRSLTIRYEGAWWDASIKKYVDDEIIVSIIAESRLTQTKGRRKAGALPPSYVHWGPRFLESVQNGNLKTLDLRELTKLRRPTSQQIYRFLDKRFRYLADRSREPVLELDLQEFAYNHIGLTPASNIGRLKDQLRGPLSELENLDPPFIKPTSRAERYVKVQKGIWRIRLESPRYGEPSSPVSSSKHRESPNSGNSVATEIVRDFYRRWTGTESESEPTARELEQATGLIAEHGEEKARALIPLVVKVLKTRWPAAKSFGAISKYIDEAGRLYAAEQRRLQKSKAENQAKALARQQETNRQRQLSSLEKIWITLSDSERARIRDKVLESQPASTHPILNKHVNLLHRWCLMRLGEERGMRVVEDPEPRSIWDSSASMESDA